MNNPVKFALSLKTNKQTNKHFPLAVCTVTSGLPKEKERKDLNAPSFHPNGDEW